MYTNKIYYNLQYYYFILAYHSNMLLQDRKYINYYFAYNILIILYFLTNNLQKVW